MTCWSSWAAKSHFLHQTATQHQGTSFPRPSLLSSKRHGHEGGWQASPAETAGRGLLTQTCQRSQMQQIWCHRGHKH